MNETNQIREIAKKAIEDHPELTKHIKTAADLALSEIAEGESAPHELELFEQYMDELKVRT